MNTTKRYPVSEGERFAADAALEVVTCASCHMTYAIPESLKRAARRYPGPTGWSITCPLGHSWHYVDKSVNEKLREARDRGTWLQARLDQTQASLSAQRAAATRARNERDRLKRRARAGVCPCCNRTFKQLARHMASRHPDFETHGDT